ncbi:MAG: amino acid ABC transporter substrate-binding protein, partial [Desulfobacteraceae bacterium]|nr:amino acid ABC transporter substrate-binding protein [Desulfobacteraceae bacterium]
AGSGALPPYIYEENQKLSGINADVLYEACKRLNIEPEFQIMPAKRLKNSAE